MAKHIVTGATEHVDSADPRIIDRRADLIAFISFMVISLLGQGLDVWSYATEIARAGHGNPAVKVALWEFSSIFVIFALFPLIVRAVSLATPGQHHWQRLVVVHFIGVIVFSMLHILGFVILRKIGHAVFWNETYTFIEKPLREISYEFRKDVLTYVIMASIIVMSRQFSQLSNDLAVAKRDAVATKQLSVKSGGRTIYITVADILLAKSAGNYVELITPKRTVTMRVTLAALADQVLAAGGTVVRVHRSWLINPTALSELRPTGSGDSVAIMQNGEEVPVSRRYRDRLLEPVSR